MPQIAVAELAAMLQKMLTRKSVFQFDAETITQRLVDADALDLPAYGCGLIGTYLEALDAGDIDPRARVLTLSETPATAILDGSHAFGQVAATRAVELATSKAQELGCATVSVTNSQHLGAPAVYAWLAASQGLIGLCVTNTGGATVTAPGGQQAAVGNSIYAWAAPATTGRVILSQSACAKTSWEQVRALARDAGALAEGQARSATGEPTEDPACASLLTPEAGGFGFQWAFFGGVLTSLLAGARFPARRKKVGLTAGAEHFFYAIDPAKFVDADAYREEVEAAEQAMSMTDGLEEGKRNRPIRCVPRSQSDRQIESLSLSDAAIDEIRQLAKQLGVSELS